jgi:hypothetical protein
MAGLVAGMVLGSETEMERSLVGADIAVVEGSLVEGDVHSLVAGVEEGYWHSLVRGGRVSAKGRERSWVEEGKEIGFLEERSWVALHSLVEEDSHPDVGYRRSNRYLTL